MIVLIIDFYVGSLFYRRCFISCQNLDSAKKFKNAINQALADCGGVFWEDIKDFQLQSLLRKMTRDYFINGGKAKKARFCEAWTKTRTRERHICFQ